METHDALTIGDTTRDGLLQIVDTAWDGNGTMRVTVREMIGGPNWSWTLPKPVVRERARRLARRALPEYRKGQTRSARTIRESYSEGSFRWTFAVTRLERDS